MQCDWSFCHVIYFCRCKAHNINNWTYEIIYIWNILIHFTQNKTAGYIFITQLMLQTFITHWGIEIVPTYHIFSLEQFCNLSWRIGSLYERKELQSDPPGPSQSVVINFIHVIRVLFSGPRLCSAFLFLWWTYGPCVKIMTTYSAAVGWWVNKSKYIGEGIE